uniref:hypothetical protein n=1 Tax=Okeania sp. SIO2F4 TaxID=2607790 RepID=UPI0025D8BC52|nr:hypothetical protein [Okeania sp. SIO2F4]
MLENGLVSIVVRFVWRDVNAALNILEVVQPKTKVETVKETVAENPVQLSLFGIVAGGAVRDIKQDEEQS